MSSTVVNITAQAGVAAGVAPGAAAGGVLGAFEAVMGAFFAGVDGVPADGKGSPFAGDGAPDPAQHNLDVAKLPPKAHPAMVAATALTAQPAVAPGVPVAASPDVLADGLVQTATATAESDLVGALVEEPGANPVKEPGADEVQTTPAAGDALALELAALAQTPAPGAPPVGPTTPAAAEGESAAPPAALPPTALPSAGAEPPTPAAEVAEAAPPKPADKDEKPKAIPGANASDTARLHAAPNSAVARAAAAQAEAPAAPPVEAPPPAAAELAVAATQAPAESAPPSAPVRKTSEKPVRGQTAAPTTEAAPQDHAQPARTEASAPSDAPATDKPPKLSVQAADAPSAQPAQPEEGMAAAPAEPSARTHAASAPAAETAPVRGSPETVASLSAQIVKKLGARSTHFDVQLDPVGLGKVNVRVAINADGQVSAAMRFDNPQAAAELRSRASELQRALAQSGFDLSGGLSFDVAQDQGGGYGGQQNAFMNNDNDSGHAFRGRAFAAAMETAGDAAQAALPGAYGQARGPATGVDVRI